MYWSNKTVPESIVYSKAFQQGLSFVEAMRIKDGKLAYLEQHLDRLYAAFEDFNERASIEKDQLEKALTDYISCSPVKNGRGRVQSFDDEGLQSVVMTVDDYGYDSDSLLTEGITLGLTTNLRPVQDSRFKYKTNQYLSALMEQKKQPNCHEIIGVNDVGNITEGLKSNVFFVVQNHVYTPDLACNILGGIMRQQVAEILGSEGFEISTGCYTIEDIIGAESIFVTNALMPVAVVSTFLGKHYKPLSPELMRIFKTL